ncbi:MAG: tetratricopeptide repeat protein [Cytophagaceae bacterium]|nr:tetratricopeptide repeat protein [Cytophagaceae bacterium]
MSTTFHNTTAHYNAYFLAREKMKEVDAQIITSNVDDYSKILSVYPLITTGTRGTIKPGLEEVIKKASLINEKHKNSKWLDDSYIIIGKSFYYKKEYKTALAFFKFVNYKSQDANARHAALILLMRTYIDSADYASAKTVSDYLSKKGTEGEVFSEENTKNFHLTKAYYHQQLEEYKEMLSNVEIALPLIKKRQEKGRINFIAGQLNQMFNKDSSAYENYRATIKTNPPYDLLFHSKLYLTQVSPSTNQWSKKKTQKYFNKLANDKKNTEYKDKIYYELGLYYLKRGDVKESISNLEKSLRETSKNPSQKGLSYLKLGEIYYDNENFELSKQYYDSAVTAWDKNDKNYKPISTRQKVLEEFVRHKQTAEREDSLQRIAKLSKDQLDKLIDQIIEDEKEKIKNAENQKKKKFIENNNVATNTDTDPGNFALTNPAAIATGKVEFTKVWGTRKLEDNWRRSNKETSFDFVEEKQNKVETDTLTQDSLNAKPKEIVINRDQFYKDIPYTQQQLDTSNKKLENSLYNIGKIYNQKLNEPENSIKSFNELLKRFPESEYKAEIYYFIYLIYKNKNDNSNSEAYKNKLFNEFPNSLYTKLLRNPNYLQDNKEANQQAHLKYKEAFELYKSGDYKAADSLIKVTRIQFPDNDIDDKLSLLNILIVGQTANAVVYKEKLQQFIDNYGSSPLLPKAKELLAAADTFMNKKAEKGQSVTAADVKYSTELNMPHHFVVVLPSSIPSKKVVKEFNSYNDNFIEKFELGTDITAISDTTYMVVVSGFPEKFNAQVYANNLKNDKSFFQNNGYVKYPLFIITTHNFQLFLESKNIEGYLKFYKEKY